MKSYAEVITDATDAFLRDYMDLVEQGLDTDGKKAEELHKTHGWVLRFVDVKSDVLMGMLSENKVIDKAWVWRYAYCRISAKQKCIHRTFGPHE